MKVLDVHAASLSGESFLLENSKIAFQRLQQAIEDETLLGVFLRTEVAEFSKCDPENVRLRSSSNATSEIIFEVTGQSQPKFYTLSLTTDLLSALQTSLYKTKLQIVSDVSNQNFSEQMFRPNTEVEKNVYFNDPRFNLTEIDLETTEEEVARLTDEIGEAAVSPMLRCRHQPKSKSSRMSDSDTEEQPTTVGKVRSFIGSTTSYFCSVMRNFLEKTEISLQNLLHPTTGTELTSNAGTKTDLQTSLTDLLQPTSSNTIFKSSSR